MNADNNYKPKRDAMGIRNETEKLDKDAMKARYMKIFNLINAADKKEAKNVNI